MANESVSYNLVFCGPVNLNGKHNVAFKLEVNTTSCSVHENKVAFRMFRRIFVNEFIIGFSSPASDVCTKCTRLKSMIKEEGTEEKKQELRAE
nr:unnamed protein product [Callosobruchus analis]